MPFLQVEIDAIKEAQGVAGATGLNLAQVVGGLNLLWAHCWQKRTDITTASQLAGHFCAPGVEMIEPLIAFEFLERLPDGTLRVKGAEKYLRISQAQSAAAKKTNAMRRSDRSSERSDGALSPITDHRSPDQEDLIPEADQNVISPAAHLQKLWGEVMPHPPFPRWVTVSEDRKKAARARWEENPSEGYWREVLLRISRSPWCRGEIAGRDGKTWIADPDFLLRPGTHGKAMEGKYDPRAVVTPIKPPGPKFITEEERQRGIYPGAAK